MVWPRLTTIRQPVRGIGLAAIDLITKHNPRRHGWSETPPAVRLDFKLVVRKSTARIARRRR
jgi:DNA-binding LacI/PurR family transcriptional regulator